MDEKELLEKIKQDKEIVKDYYSKEIFEVEIDSKKYEISREKIEDQLGDEFYNELRKYLDEKKQKAD